MNNAQNDLKSVIDELNLKPEQLQQLQGDGVLTLPIKPKL